GEPHLPSSTADGIHSDLPRKGGGPDVTDSSSTGSGGTSGERRAPETHWGIAIAERRGRAFRAAGRYVSRHRDRGSGRKRLCQIPRWLTGSKGAERRPSPFLRR